MSFLNGHPGNQGPELGAQPLKYTIDKGVGSKGDAKILMMDDEMRGFAGVPGFFILVQGPGCLIKEPPKQQKDYKLHTAKYNSSRILAPGGRLLQVPGLLKLGFRI